MVLPMFRTFGAVFCGAQPLVDTVEDNYAYWRSAAMGGNMSFSLMQPAPPAV